MVRIPYMKIQSVRVGSIDPTSDIGTGGATPAPPTPITYLTQWKIVGNSEVHTDPYLTSWKVSGNSVVDNNTILSCGDLEQDGKYHVKISNGVDIYDIALTEPLRKVNNVADNITFANNTAVVTRNLASTKIGDLRNWFTIATDTLGYKRYSNSSLQGIIKDTDNIVIANILSSKYTAIRANDTYSKIDGVGISSAGIIRLYDSNYHTDELLSTWLTIYADVEIVYELATATTETIQAPQIAVSPTDTYTSANDTPYSAFEHTENKEIWSCGEYSAVDGKYHILVQPLDGSIADIALTEPLRKVNDVADTIEFPSGTDGKALVTRNLGSVDMGDYTYQKSPTNLSQTYRYISTEQVTNLKNTLASEAINALCSRYSVVSADTTYLHRKGVSVVNAYNTGLSIYLEEYKDGSYEDTIKNILQGVEIIFELATPTTELVDAPQIEEADSYTCVISQGGKAVEWSSFETDSE